MMLDAKIPGGPVALAWERHRFELKLVNPANKRKFRVIVVGTGLAGASAAATLAELGYEVDCFCFQDSAAARALDRRAGRHQRGEELPERRRQRVSPVLRHGEGRRLPRARGQRAPAGGGQRGDHRPVRGAGRAVRPRVRRHAGQPLLRRRAGLAHVLRARPDRAAAAARLLRRRSRARSRRGKVRMHARTEMLDLVVVEGRARGIVTRDLVTGKVERWAGRRRGAGHGRLRQRLLPLHQRQGLQRDGDLARPQARRRLRQPVLHADPPHVHPDRQRALEQAHADERVAAQRRARVGAQGARRPARSRPDPRGRARLLPGAELPELRQPGAPRHCLARRQGRVRRGPRRGPVGPRRVPRLRRGDQAAGPRRDRAEVRQPVRHVRQHHRRGPLPGPDAHLPGPALHDGRPVGGLRPDEHRARPVRARRGELLRPRRQPARRQRADAGAGRRLLHPARTRWAASWPARAARRRRTEQPGLPRGGGAGGRAHAAAAAR